MKILQPIYLLHTLHGQPEYFVTFFLMFLKLLLSAFVAVINKVVLLLMEM